MSGVRITHSYTVLKISISLWILGWIYQDMKSQPAYHTHWYKDNDWRPHSVVEKDLTPET